MLISSCTVVCWKVESSSSEAKVVRIGAESVKIFPRRPGKGPIDYLSLRWREKSNSGFEFRRENCLEVQIFRNSSVEP